LIGFEKVKDSVVESNVETNVRITNDLKTRCCFEKKHFEAKKQNIENPTHQV
jgi:hypothetical protein